MNPPTDYWLLSNLLAHLNGRDERFRQRPEDLHELRATLRGEVRARPLRGVARARAARAAQAAARGVGRRPPDRRLARTRDGADKFLRHLASDRPGLAPARRRESRRRDARPAPARAARADSPRAARARRRARLARAHGSLRPRHAPTPSATRARSRAGGQPRPRAPLRARR